MRKVCVKYPLNETKYLLYKNKTKNESLNQLCRVREDFCYWNSSHPLTFAAQCAYRHVCVVYEDVLCPSLQISVASWLLCNASCFNWLHTFSIACSKIVRPHKFLITKKKQFIKVKKARILIKTTKKVNKYINKNNENILINEYVYVILCVM